MRVSAIVVTLLPLAAAVPASPGQSACPVPANGSAPPAGTSNLVEVKVYKDDEYKGAWRNLVLKPGVCRDLTTEFPGLTSVKPAAGVQCTLFKSSGSLHLLGMSDTHMLTHVSHRQKCASAERLGVPETGNPNIGNEFNDNVRGISCQPVALP
ncbi:hypothetical protein BCR34DRAFT_50923 [Clohesyomyces aquaticus]|uniref:DUF3617 family protein n=1 Tax=Clohesyomyces aquaticus TaxID=1231657 RepID=A0A1Y2A3Z6_9PLEO|nr:hypothetical protein BCR34DRAFT_50923 [Clohesyomyces aquaticus]